MKILVLYYSAFGYVTVLANAVAEGARSAGASVDVKRVAESIPGTGAQGAHFVREQNVPTAVVGDLANYDAIIVGSPTRYGRLAAQMAGFLEQADDLAKRGLLNGKVGAAFTSPSSRRGGQESAAASILTNLLHFGMIVVGPPCSAATLTDDTGQRYPSVQDLEDARQLGVTTARTTQRLTR